MPPYATLRTKLPGRRYDDERVAAGAGRNSLTSLGKPLGRPMTPTSANPNLGETPIMLRRQAEIYASLPRSGKPLHSVTGFSRALSGLLPACPRGVGCPGAIRTRYARCEHTILRRGFLSGRQVIRWQARHVVAVRPSVSSNLHPAITGLTS
jgi:hypothetical protein